MNDVISPEHMAAARRFRRLYSAFQQNHDLISVGAYQKGSNPEVDEAIEYFPYLMQFLQQNYDEAVPFEHSLESLLNLTGVN